MQKPAFTNLAQLLAHIKQTGLFDPYTLPFSAKFTRNVKLYFYTDHQNGFFVKACPGSGAKREYQALTFASNKTDGHVPEPLHFFEIRDLTAYVSPLYRFQPVTAKYLLGKPFQDQICRILSIGVVPDRTCPPIDADPIPLARIKDFATEQHIIDKTNHHCMPYLDHSHDLLQTIGCIPQHGDATPYNFSLDHNSIFLCDWEDFGIINFPGFDLATFIFEMCGLLKNQDVLALAPDTLTRQELLKIIEPVLSAGELSFKHWQKCFPFYILAFATMKMKLGYHSAYVQKLADFTKKMFQAKNWQDSVSGLMP